jgi:sugar O-acyltransferase (sialic acid O-acetyltransferase NeuD family)
MKKLIIIGDGEFAQIAYEYFSADSPYKVCGFCVEPDFLKQITLYDLPVVSLETIVDNFPPTDFDVFVAITYTQLNRLRTRLYTVLKEKGYSFATYISSRAFVWPTATIGENCFIFENNVIQHHVSIGNNVILWSGNHIGHRVTIKDHCFISSHVVVSGYATIGKRSFVGVNSTLIDYIKVGDDCFIGAACLINKDVKEKSLCTPEVSHQVSKISSLKFFKIKEDLI